MFFLRLIWAVVHALFAKRANLVAENLALRQQLNVLRRKVGRPRLRKADRTFWLWLARTWSGWRDSLIVVKPETVVRWHRQGLGAQAVLAPWGNNNVAPWPLPVYMNRGCVDPAGFQVLLGLEESTQRWPASGVRSGSRNLS